MSQTRNPGSCCAVLEAFVTTIVDINSQIITLIFRNIVQVIKGKLNLDVQLKNHDYSCEIRPSAHGTICPPPKPTPCVHPQPRKDPKFQHGVSGSHGHGANPGHSRHEKGRCSSRPFVCCAPPPCRKSYF